MLHFYVTYLMCFVFIVSIKQNPIRPYVFKQVSIDRGIVIEKEKSVI